MHSNNLSPFNTKFYGVASEWHIIQNVMEKTKKLVVSGQMDGCTFPSHLPPPFPEKPPISMDNPQVHTSSYLPPTRIHLSMND